MKQKKIVVVSFLIGVFLSCHSAVVHADESFIQIKGSDTMVNLSQAWAEGYMEKYPQSFIAVTGGGSGTGIASLLNGTCDIAQTSRKMKQKEFDLAHKKGIRPIEFEVALDGLAVVVHKDNPVEELTLSQLSDIFTGTIVNWKELGGIDSEIVLLSREINSGTHVYFKEHILSKGTSGHKEFSPNALLMPSSQAIADEIALNPQAIGYYGMGYLNPNQKAVAVALDADSPFVLPTLENVTQGKYAISRPLFIYTNNAPAGAVKDYMDFILSDEGQILVLDVDFIPVKPVYYRPSQE